MATITITFDSVEEAEDVRTALDGYKWKLAMWDLDQKLRSTVRHGSSIINHDKPASSEEMEIAEKLREEIRDVLQGYSINLEN